jgi:hypothetical protein
MEMLFERFISKERNEPPDIDVDFEHERREEVIQYVYRKYGRERAAIAATVISYRLKSAVRDVGKALGLDLAQVDRLAKNLAWWDARQVRDQRLREVGFDPGSRVIQRLLALVNIIVGFPRHLSQHVGGFVISRGPLSRLVPIENAAMPERTVIEWDKDDLDALGLLKIDVLALGMLTAIRRALDLVAAYRKRPFTMADVPPEDAGVYEMVGPRRYHRRFPDRVARAAGDAAAHASAVFLRSGDRGGDRAPGSDPGRHDPSLFAPPAGVGAGHRIHRRCAAGTGAHTGRTDLSGAGDAARRGGGRVHPGEADRLRVRWPHGADAAASSRSSSA